MRIAVAGDFHIQLNELQMTMEAMEDLAACRPDLVVPLGDFGSNDTIGGVEGLFQAHRYLRTIGVPLRPILGNHDLQRESGYGFQAKGTVEAAFRDLYGLDSAYGVIELEHARLFFISTDPQPPESCYQIQECFISDTQFERLRSDLDERPGVPCIMFSHAPPIGSGLRTVPQVHVRATNAYLDQNHDPFRWLTLVRSRPEIVVWLSAHYHLGHGHPDSSTERYGTRFFTTGVHSGVTRDGQRQSRLIDLEEDRIRVHTIDHISRALTAEADWSGDSLRMLVKRKRELLELETPVPLAKPDAIERPDDDAAANKSAKAAPMRLYMHSVGVQSAALRRIVPLSDSRCLVIADDGYLWEADFRAEAVLGSLHLGQSLTDAVATEDSVWRAWDRTLARSDPRVPERFQRESSARKDELRLLFNEDITLLSAGKGKSVWVGCGRHLYEVVPEERDGKVMHALAHPVLVTDNGPRIAKLIERTDGRLQWIDENGLLWSWDRNRFAAPALENEYVSAWDVFGEDEANVRHGPADTAPELRCCSADGQWTMPLPQIPEGSTDIVCLGGSTVVVLMNGSVWLWEAAAGSLTAVNAGPGKVTAIARAGTNLPGGFGMTTAAADAQLPQLQIWQTGNGRQQSLSFNNGRITERGGEML